MSAHSSVLITFLVASAIAAAQSGDARLAPGTPPLTLSMVEKRIAIWEWFLEAKLTPQQRVRFEKYMVDAWPTNKGDVVKNTLEDIALVGKEAELKPARQKLQGEYVEKLRRETDEESRVLLEAWEAAHPARKDLMTARGLGHLVGQWRFERALTPSRNTFTGQPDGVSFTDSLILDIYSDFRFHHLWANSHCSGGVTCCKAYGTEVRGTFTIEGSTLVLNADPAGDFLYEDACARETNKSGKLEQTRESFRWSVEKDPTTKKPMLCLSQRPFQFARAEGEKTICYRKHTD